MTVSVASRAEFLRRRIVQVVGGSRRGLAWVTDAVVAGVHGLALFAAVSPRFQWLVGLLFVATMSFRVPAWIELGRSPMLRLVSCALLLAYVAAFWRAYAYVVRPNQAWLVAALAGSTLVVGRGGAVPRWFVVPAAVTLGWLGRDLPRPIASKLVLVAAVLMADVLASSRSMFERAGREVTASFLATLGCLVVAASFYYGPDPTGTEEIRTQPGVTILAAGGSGPLTERSQVYAVVPACDGRSAVVVIHKSNQGYHLLDIHGARFDAIGAIRDPSDDVLFRCRKDEVIFGDWRAGKGLVARASALPTLATIRAYDNLVVGPGPLVESPDGRLLWHLDARDMKMRVADSSSGRLLAETDRFSLGLAAIEGDRAFSAAPGELVSWRLERVVSDAGQRSCAECSGRLIPRTVAAIDRGWLKPLRWLVPNASIHYTAAAGDRVFVSSLQDGSVEAFASRGETISPVVRVRVDGGARHIAYSRRWDLVMVSGWTSGVVTVLGGRDLAVLRVLRVGTRPRTVSLTDDESTAMVGTAAGIVAIDLAAIAAPVVVPRVGAAQATIPRVAWAAPRL